MSLLHAAAAHCTNLPWECMEHLLKEGVQVGGYQIPFVGLAVDTTWPPRWPLFFQRFCELEPLKLKIATWKTEGWWLGGKKTKPFRLALVNEHCRHRWEGKWAVLHQKVWYHGHAADCQIVTCSWKEVLDVLWRFYPDSRSQKWDRMEFIESTSFCLELISVHVVVLFPIRNTVTPRLFNTNLRKDYSLINGSTALLATTFRGTLALNFSCWQIEFVPCLCRLRTWPKGNVGALKTLLRARGDPHYFGTSSNRDVMKRSCIPERLGIVEVLSLNIYRNSLRDVVAICGNKPARQDFPKAAAGIRGLSTKRSLWMLVGW